MIRTNVVSLSSIPGIAYRQKLPSGGSGIVLLREDGAQPGIASISKTSGEAIPTANTPKELYPKEAFQEATNLTAGLPYKKQGNVQLKGIFLVGEPAAEEQAEEEAVVDGDDYVKIVEKYTDNSGKLSYDLINKDMIRFIHSSSVARKMIADGESVENIRLYAAGSKFRGITKNHTLTNAQVLKIIELFDEVSPKGVFKEFNEDIRKKLKARKK